jgi:glutamyl-tRNA reductase
MLKLQETFGILEVLVLSTCNRTEVYYMTQGEKKKDIIKLLATQKAIPSETILPYVEFIENQESAIQYLFEVALGLHSQVVGDLQIPNQIKNAYQWSADLNFSGPFLHRLLHAIFFVNKRVVQETAFRDGAASTSYAAIEAIETFLPLLNNPKILVVGLGEIGKDVALTLGDKGYENIAGFCKVADLDEIKNNDYILTPGRYVGLEAEIEDLEPFDDKMKRLSSELGELFEQGDKLQDEVKKQLESIGWKVDNGQLTKDN